MASETADFRISALMLLARGRPPSQRHVITTTSESLLAKQTQPSWTILAWLWMGSVAVKTLVFATQYHSTDLYVHRHWKSVTQHLAIQDWYLDDQFVATTHTVDYPPLFMLLEWLLAQLMPIHCIQLMDDAQLDTLDKQCIGAMRATVLFTDIVYWWGCYSVCRALMDKQQQGWKWNLFLLLLFHPSLLFLDVVHFQYNGMLVGVLLLCLSFLLRRRFVWATLCFGVLCSLKHLYVTSVPWFLVVLYSASRSWRQRLQLATVLGATALLPLVPFLLATDNPVVWVKQVLSRLFPFERGLVHDYWAGNVWVFYTILTKVLKKMQLDWAFEVTPLLCGALTLFFQLPGLTLARRSCRDGRLHKSHLLLSFVYVNLVNFLFQYHGHEKAILTALLPSLALAGNENLWDFHATCLFSLFPLLFPKTELLLKITASVLYLVALHSLSAYNKVTIWKAVVLIDGVFVLDVVDHSPLFGKYEFAPLALTSLVCAIFYCTIWFRLLRRTLQAEV